MAAILSWGRWVNIDHYVSGSFSRSHMDIREARYGPPEPWTPDPLLTDPPPVIKGVGPNHLNDGNHTIVIILEQQVHLWSP